MSTPEVRAVCLTIETGPGASRRVDVGEMTNAALADLRAAMPERTGVGAWLLCGDWQWRTSPGLASLSGLPASTVVELVDVALGRVKTQGARRLLEQIREVCAGTAARCVWVSW